MTRPLVDAGSFRDPSGRVYKVGKEIFRTVSPSASEHYEFVKGSGLLESLADRGMLVTCEEVDRSALGEAAESARLVLRHSRVPFVTYPYEWSFSLLKSAALLHLDIQIEALDRGVSLSDASAYNVQFEGTRPVFIDALSFRRYSEGEHWNGHRQFCEQFLNPLLLRALFGIPHNSWFRGSLEGIETERLAAMIPWWRNLSFNLLTHVTMLARLQRRAGANQEKMTAKAQRTTLSRQSYLGMLHQLRSWIAKLQPRDTGATIWQDYDHTHSYESSEEKAKARFIGQFTEKLKPDTLWDLGCNSGQYSEVALKAGAGRVIGFDFDQGALERAYARAEHNSLNLLPLFQDAANPSPSQGWNVAERPGLAWRRAAVPRRSWRSPSSIIWRLARTFRSIVLFLGSCRLHPAVSLSSYRRAIRPCSNFWRCVRTFSTTTLRRTSKPRCRRRRGSYGRKPSLGPDAGCSGSIEVSRNHGHSPYRSRFHHCGCGSGRGLRTSRVVGAFVAYLPVASVSGASNSIVQCVSAGR